jgi:probable dihydroxyacetone kinase regulator
MADSNITKNALAASLKNLMREKPFAKISVSDICEQCGMNRKSFYYHFKDKYDLVNWIFMVDFLGKMDLESYHNGWDAVYDICYHFYEDRDFYLPALKIDGQNSFHDYVIDTLRPLIAYFTEDLFQGGPEQEFFYVFFADAFLHSIMRWLQDDMQMSPAEFVGSLHEVFRHIALKTMESGEKEELSSQEL